ncbi:NmrA family NAD(P)-binding protein [Rhodococcus wratislaviensis]|nr:NmrA family NAD(P)-binding protein [Rhodococcus sp. 3A]MBC2897325.1 NmrA family NAD(P)-binding protein [Rhodococcus sp. 4CII]
MVAELHAVGSAPTALVRDQAKAVETLRTSSGERTFGELIVGELTDTDLVESAMRDVDVAFLALGSSPDQVALEKRVIDAAARTGLAHLIKLSAAYANSESSVSVLRVHAEINDYLAANAVPSTLISPSTFMEIVYLGAVSLRETDGWVGTAPRGANALIDSQDVVDAVIAVIRDPSTRGGEYVLTGPTALTWPDVAAALSKTVGREITYRPVDVAERVAQLHAAGLDDWRIELLIGLDDINRHGLYAEPTTDFERLTGRPPRDITSFIARNAETFRAT